MSTCSCDNKVAVLLGGKRVRMKNGETMAATYKALLPFPQPPLADRNYNVFPVLQQPLLSLVQFCNAGFTATLDSETVQRTKDVIATLSGTRDHTNGLYFVPLHPNYNVPTRNVYTNLCIPQYTPSLHLFQQRVSQTLPALVQFLHRACFIFVVDTWYKAIDAGYFTTYPGLTSRIVRKNLPKSNKTAKGHLRISNQHVRSTSSQSLLTPPP